MVGRNAGLVQAAWLGLLLLPIAAIGQEPEPPPLRIASVEVTPSDPGDETLCQLRVQIENRGDRPAYAAGFDVSLNGEGLSVYDDVLYYQQLAPGETSEIRLFNFWTTETGRPRPTDGKLEVEVVLREAAWLEVSRAPGEDGGEDVEVWAPAGAVEGLPLSSSRVLDLGDG